MNELFRPEVAEARRIRLAGEVVIRHTLPTRLAVFGVIGVVTVIIVWMCVATYARIVTAPGILATDSPSVRVEVPAAGVLSELKVAEGKVVKKGTPVAVVTVDRQIELNKGYAGESLAALDARLDIGAKRLNLMREQISAEQLGLEATLQSTQEQIAQLKEQIDLQEKIVSSNRMMFEQIGDVMKKGFMSKTEYERRRQQLLSSQQSLSSLRQNLSTRLLEAAQARQGLANLSIEAQTNAASIDNDINLLKQQRAEARSKIAYVITAPISGIVTAVQTAVGRSVDPSLPLMSVIPEKSALVAEVYAPTSAIGFVRTGQEVRILYDAFPYRQFGSFAGRVKSISRDVIDPRRVNAPLNLQEPVYKVLVSLADQSVKTAKENADLQSGMTFEANLILERKSFLEWLLNPIRAVRRRAA